MGYPIGLLLPGEELVLDLRPHWVALVLAGSVAALEVAVMIWLLTLVEGSWNWVVLAVLLIALIVYPVRRLMWWLSSHFVVTSDRVIHREGWFAKRSMDIPLEAIQDVRFSQSVIGRLIGAGSLVIRSASEAGRQEFRAIRNPEDVQKAIYRERQKNQQEMLQTPAPEVTPPSQPLASQGGAPSTVTELERLADLRTRGVLTEEEFQLQKSRILDQA